MKKSFTERTEGLLWGLKSEGFSQKDLAKLTGVSEATVSNAISRAKTRASDRSQKPKNQLEWSDLVDSLK